MRIVSSGTTWVKKLTDICIRDNLCHVLDILLERGYYSHHTPGLQGQTPDKAVLTTRQQNNTDFKNEKGGSSASEAGKCQDEQLVK